MLYYTKRGLSWAPQSPTPPHFQRSYFTTATILNIRLSLPSKTPTCFPSVSPPLVPVVYLLPKKLLKDRQCILSSEYMAALVATQYNMPNDVVQHIDSLVSTISSADDYKRIQLKKFTTGIIGYYCMHCDEVTDESKTYKHGPCYPCNCSLNYERRHRWNMCIISPTLHMYSVFNNKVKEIDIKVSLSTTRSIIKSILKSQELST